MSAIDDAKAYLDAERNRLRVRSEGISRALIALAPADETCYVPEPRQPLPVCRLKGCDRVIFRGDDRIDGFHVRCHVG